MNKIKGEFYAVVLAVSLFVAGVVSLAIWVAALCIYAPVGIFRLIFDKK
jgi:hypothetical protein